MVDISASSTELTGMLSMEQMLPKHFSSSLNKIAQNTGR